MKALLDKNGFDRRPHHVAPNCWYYEETDGLHVYFDGAGLIGIIKWRSLRASVARANAASDRKMTSTVKSKSRRLTVSSS